MKPKKELKLIATADGSHSLYAPAFGDTYHSEHGAIREAEHVYIRAGLARWHEQKGASTRISLLELGFGTGLNALLSLRYAARYGLHLHYVALEAHPISPSLAGLLNYSALLSLTKDEQALFEAMHLAGWNDPVRLSPNFILEKRLQTFETLSDRAAFDLVYYDAFGPKSQPHLWGEEMVKRVHRALRPGGLMTTFCAQGAFRRNLQAVGFQVERLPGPPGKREMLRACRYVIFLLYFLPLFS